MTSEIICIIDRSGSMTSMATEAIGGFNQFLKEQQAIPDDCKLTLVLFDHVYDVIHNAVNIQNVHELNDSVYIPRGATALYDAMGKALDDAMARIQHEYTTPPRVAVMIMTDGQENASKNYTKSRLEKFVEDLKKDQWQFIFMSSDLASFDKDLGTMTIGTMQIGHTSTVGSYYNATAQMSNSIRAYRNMGTVNTSSVYVDNNGETDHLTVTSKSDSKDKDTN